VTSNREQIDRELHQKRRAFHSPHFEIPGHVRVASRVEDHVEGVVTFESVIANDEGPRGVHMVPAVEIADFLRREFPQTRCVVEAVGDGTSTVSLEITGHELRPGGTVAGPVLMSVADIALYVAIFGKLGIIPLAVTTSFTINFLRRPAADRAILGKCNLMKVGHSLVVGDVALYSRGQDEIVAHAVGTYSIPRGGVT
jgi:acyl-coenzyme A thioesterase PaaI-like protein